MGSRALIHPRFLAQTAGRLGRGGATWTRRRYTGDGVASARALETAQVAAYAWKASDLRDALGLPPVNLSDAAWYVGALPGADLRGEDTIESASEPGFSLTIAGPADDVLPGVTLWRAEQRGG